MIIKSGKQNYFAISNLTRYVKKYSFVKISVSLLLIFIFIGFSLSLIMLGIRLHKFKYAETLNDIRYELLTNKTAFIPNYFKGILAKPQRFAIDIKFKYLQKIDYYRNLSIKRGLIYPDVKQEEFPAFLTFNGERYKVKLSLTGQNLDHIATSKVSYRVKITNDKTILGMKEFALLIPNARSYLAEWIVHMLQKREDLISLRYNFVDVSINGTHKGIYCLEEHFDKRLIENNRYREGIIFKPGIQDITVYNKKQIESDPVLRSRLVMLKNLWQSFINDDIPVEKLFNIEKLSKDYAITDLVNGHHSKFTGNMRYYFNPINNLIEPISREFGWLRYGDIWRGTSNTDLFINRIEDYSEVYQKKLFKSSRFFELYIKELNKMSQTEYLDAFFSEIKPMMDKKLSLIYRVNPFYTYPKEFLYNNQKIIKEKLDPVYEVLLRANYEKIANGIVVDFQNQYFLPIEIKHIVSKDSLMFKSSQRVVIPSNKISQNQSFQFEFYSNKDVALAKNIRNNLYVYYSILGLDEIKTCKVFPYRREAANNYKHNPTTYSDDFSDLEFVVTDTKNRIIYIKEGKHTLNKRYTIQPNYTVVADKGLEINFQNGASIISYSHLKLSGTEESPIIITSTDSTGQGILVLETKAESVLDYVYFNNLSNPSQNGWELTGAVTFYESDVSINNCVFSNNRRGDDYLNIVRSKFDIKNTLFSDTKGDAFDADFSKGSISNVSVMRCGNDAIDISGTILKIDNVFFDTIGDKGLSAGENSQIIANNVNISNSEIAVCSKDMSVIKISDVNLQNIKIGFTAFQKKDEFGPGRIQGSNVQMKKVSIPYLIETYSNCTIDGEIIESNDNSVKDVLYGAKYGKSSK